MIDDLRKTLERLRVPPRAVNLLVAEGMPANVFEAFRRPGIGARTVSKLRKAGLIAEGGYPASFKAERAVEALDL